MSDCATHADTPLILVVGAYCPDCGWKLTGIRPHWDTSLTLMAPFELRRGCLRDVPFKCGRCQGPVLTTADPVAVDA